MTILSSKTLVDNALKEIKTISTEEAFDMFNKNQCNLIDIRDIRELENEGRIENSNHIPRGMLEFWLDPSSSYYQEKKIGEIKNLVLYCALGLRSALATKSLQEMGFQNVSNAHGGFESLKNIGLPVIQKDKK